MDLLHTQLNKIQQQLAFVAVDPINWKGYVQAFSWLVTLFESYLLCVLALGFRSQLFYLSKKIDRIRQYPLYSKKEPPASLAEHFDDGVFDKSQKYGKDKAKFALFSGLYKQIVDSVALHYGLYAWAWAAGGKLLSRFGFGSEHEVRTVFGLHLYNAEFLGADSPINSFRLHTFLCFIPPNASFGSVQDLRP